MVAVPEAGKTHVSGMYLGEVTCPQLKINIW